MAALVASSTVCSVNLKYCGKEVIALATAGKEFLTFTKDASGDQKRHIDPPTLALYWSVTTTAADAFAACTVDTYELLDAAGNALTDASVVSLINPPGPAMAINVATARANYLFSLRATTKGGI